MTTPREFAEVSTAIDHFAGNADNADDAATAVGIAQHRHSKRKCNGDMDDTLLAALRRDAGICNQSGWRPLLTAAGGMLVLFICSH